MKKEAIVTQMSEYFRESDHWRRLIAAIQDPQPRFAHAHIYVYTSVHPDSLEAILRGYFAARGWPISRRINRIRPKPNILALHGIEPAEKVHWDFHWLYQRDMGIAPAHGVENGSNLLVWNKTYIDEFYRLFPFEKVGPQQESALQRYFTSDHWNTGLDIVAQPNVPHMHINIETTIHPDTIGRYAVDSLHERGWDVFYLCPNCYLLEDRYAGKIVFMGKEPEKVYDIGWKFNPKATIEPTNHTWLFPDRVGYDVMTSEQFENEVAANEYTLLNQKEIDEIVSNST